MHCLIEGEKEVERTNDYHSRHCQLNLIFNSPPLLTVEHRIIWSSNSGGRKRDGEKTDMRNEDEKKSLNWALRYNSTCPRPRFDVWLVGAPGGVAHVTQICTRLRAWCCWEKMRVCVCVCVCVLFTWERKREKREDITDINFLPSHLFVKERSLFSFGNCHSSSHPPTST